MTTAIAVSNASHAARWRRGISTLRACRPAPAFLSEPVAAPCLAASEPDEQPNARVMRAQAGDLEAFNDLVLENERLVYNACFRILEERQAAEDATQETFIAAWRHIGSVRPQAFRAWLYRIASNTSKTHLRRLRRRAETVVFDTADWEGTEPGPEAQAMRGELKDTISQALSRLSLDQRQTVVLWHEAGLGYEEIARVTQTSVGTVKSRLFRGRRRLAELLQVAAA